jgi:hypothetical protein
LGTVIQYRVRCRIPRQHGPYSCGRYYGGNTVRKVAVYGPYRSTWVTLNGDKAQDGHGVKEPTNFDDKEEEEEFTNENLNTLRNVNRNIFFYLIVFTL